MLSRYERRAWPGLSCATRYGGVGHVCQWPRVRRLRGPRALGAVVTKGVSLEPWEGNQSPRIAETAWGMLNSIGLQNPGVEAFIAEDLTCSRSRCSGDRQRLRAQRPSMSESSSVWSRLMWPPTRSTSRVPMWTMGGWRSVHRVNVPQMSRRACREATERPLIVKLSPNVTDVVEIAQAVEDAGADAVSLINTLLGMAVDAQTFKPKLARVVGGLPARLSSRWRCAWSGRSPQLSMSRSIGMGGIMTAEDAVEFMLAAQLRWPSVPPTSSILGYYAHRRWAH